MPAKLHEIIDGQFIYGVLSQRRKGAPGPATRVTVSPFMQKGELSFQLTFILPDRATHENLTPAAAAQRIAELLEQQFLQAQFYTATEDIHLLAHKKWRYKHSPPSRTQSAAPAHDRRKNTLLSPDGDYDFLKQLGVMGADGRVLKAKYDKFRQINHFLELIAPVVDGLKPQDGERLRILDFGCGKAYLTFALYHHLVRERGMQVDIFGLDLKRDVVADMQRTADALGFEGLRFAAGEIKDYTGYDRVDIVITLHACDTATDDAIVKAVKLGAQVLLSVPCCQHELLNRIDNPAMRPLLRHGIVKERISSLVTDALRTELLGLCGYSADIIEFIATEHTPKNLLIRAVRTPRRQGGGDYEHFTQFWGVQGGYLETRLREEGLL